MTKQFLADMVERAIKTAVQALLAMYSADAVFDVMQADWGKAASVAGTAAFLSVLTSLLSLRLGNSGTASATDAVVPAPESHDPNLRA